MEKIITGNLDKLAPKHKGWFIGYFMEDGSPLKTTDFEIKWAKLNAGDRKPKLGTQKTAKTLDFLVSGKFEYFFPKLNKKIPLSKQGDYLFYDVGITHSWKVIEDTLLVSIRWPSIPGDQKNS